MKDTIHGIDYDTDEAKELATDVSPDGDDTLYQMADGRFFLEKWTMFLDGVKLKEWESLDDLAPELDQELDVEADQIRRQRVKRIQEIIPLSSRAAMIWTIKTQIPECFRGYLLESI